MSSLYFANYLGKIAKIPLLTRESEIKYGKLIQSKKASPDAKDKADVENAIKELAGSNLRLVVKIANNYKDSHLDIEELTFEGNLGLLIAAERFDPARGCKFSTYATGWIKQCIRVAVNKATTIRMPIRRAGQIAKLQGASSYDPDLDEQDAVQLSAETAIPEKKIRKLLERPNVRGISAGAAKKARKTGS